MPIAHPQKKRVSGFDIVSGALGSVYQPYKTDDMKAVEEIVLKKSKQREEAAKNPKAAPAKSAPKAAPKPVLKAAVAPAPVALHKEPTSVPQ